MQRRSTLHLWCLAALIACSPAEATQVFVRGTNGDLGHGHLRVANGQCFVVTAKHLVANPGEVKVVLFKGAEATAMVVERDSSDVAILKISEPSFCENVGNPRIEGLDHLLETEHSGKLELIEEDGSLLRINVDLTGVGRNQIDVI